MAFHVTPLLNQQFVDVLASTWFLFVFFIFIGVNVVRERSTKAEKREQNDMVSAEQLRR